MTNLPSSPASERRPNRSIRIQIRYRLDEAFAHGTAPVLIWLGATALCIVLAAAAVLSLLKASVDKEHPGDFLEAFWASLLRTLDPGTMGSDVGWDFRIVSLCVTLVGILFVSTLIGLIANGLDRKLDTLRRGRGVVPETGHTLIIGHTSLLTTVLKELIEANASERRACAVILGPTDLQTVSSEVRTRVTNFKTTRVVFRTGDGSDVQDLSLVNPAASRAVIVLADEQTRSDAFAIRAVLALMTFDPELTNLRIIVHCHDSRSATALKRVTNDRVITVVGDEVVGKLAAQSCRQQGLSAIYQELFDFEGAEIYFRHFPELVGCTFAQAALAFNEVSILGIRDSAGKVQLAPEPTRILTSQDTLVGVSEDDSTFLLSQIPDPFALEHMDDTFPRTQRPIEHFLIAGWSRVGFMILRELSRYVASGSTVRIAADPQHCNLPLTSEFEGLERLEVEVCELGHHDTDRLLALWEAQEPDHVLLLSYRDRLGTAEADAEVLLALLQLRHAVQIHGGASEPNVIAELLDARDVPLAETSGADDFIVSDRLAGLILTQLAENPLLDEVFEDLLDAEGAEIRLQAPPLAGTNEPETFGDLVLLGLAAGEVILGYQTSQVPLGLPSLAGGIVINPPKNSPVTLQPGDQVVAVGRR